MKKKSGKRHPGISPIPLDPLCEIDGQRFLSSQSRPVPHRFGTGYGWSIRAGETDELESIHPFADGNGRVGRFWQHVTLLEDSETFSLVPSESIIRDKQEQYYKLLRLTDRTSDATEFIDFGLEALEAALNSILPTSTAILNPQDRLSHAKEKFSTVFVDRKSYLGLFLGVSTATASRDLTMGIGKGILRKQGERNQTKYQFL